MITEDEVMRLLERADPAGGGHSPPDVDAAGYLTTLRTRSTTVTLIDTALIPARPNDRHRWPIFAVAAAAVVTLVIGVLAIAGRNSDDSQPAASPPANGLIAFAGHPGGGSASDIYVVAPDGTGLRALTSTPELAEEVPTWSPDGSRLAFVRRPTSVGSNGSPCTTACLVVVDPTGVETYSVDLPRTATELQVPRSLQVPKSLAWSPDGEQIVVIQADCGVGGCGGSGAVVVDLPTGAASSVTPSSGFAEWSPDGRWLYLEQSGESMLLVPADVVGAGDLRDADGLDGARVLPAPEGVQYGHVSGWTPDGSALFVETGVVGPDGGWKDVWIDVMSVADGQSRTVIEDGFDADVSPDGSQIAYRRVDAPDDIEPGDLRAIWVAAADGSDQRRVTISSTPPTWSPDGRLLLANDANGWFTVRPDGTGRTDITSLMPANRDFICCTYNEPSWQPLAPGSRPTPAPPVTVKTPVSEVNDWLDERADEVAFVVSSPVPSYWRLGALSEFDGTTWGMPETSLDPISGPLPSDVEPAVGSETVTQTFEITGLDGQLLPLPSAPVRVEGLDGAAFDPEGSTLVATSGTADGLEYTVTSVMPRYAVGDLQAANGTPTGSLAERHLTLPADFPAELADQARLITAGASTRYEQAIALQDWFRDFAYDLSFSAGHSQSAMVEFVEQRRGYCEQFAGTFAALARVLGLPSRVAVGFTAGELGVDGRYYVRGKHAHAWPEIYFEGIGWVPFEPTPGRGNPATAAYTGVSAAQADDGGG